MTTESLSNHHDQSGTDNLLHDRADDFVSGMDPMDGQTVCNTIAPGSPEGSQGKPTVQRGRTAPPGYRAEAIRLHHGLSPSVHRCLLRRGLETLRDLLPDRLADVLDGGRVAW
jgi:hypothetical protein